MLGKKGDNFFLPQEYIIIITSCIYICTFIHHTQTSNKIASLNLVLDHSGNKRSEIQNQEVTKSMTDHQRVHPVVVNVEAPPPTRPLVPPGSTRSEEGDPAQQHRISLGSIIAARHPPPGSTRLEKADPAQQHRISLGPVIAARPPHLEPPKRGNCWCKCLCWTTSLLVFLLIIVGAIAGILYLVFQPKLPKYSVDNLSISDLTLNFDLSLYARFNVRITAENPNKKIGIYYEKGSHLSVWYKSTNLCQGSIPRFYQGHQNKTVLNVALTGQNQYGRTLLDALQEQQQTGRIPLDLKIDVPVSIKLGKLKLKKVRILGTCKLIVDSLSTNSIISIKASTCSFGLKL